MLRGEGQVSTQVFMGETSYFPTPFEIQPHNVTLFGQWARFQKRMGHFWEEDFFFYIPDSLYVLNTYLYVTHHSKHFTYLILI